MCDNAKKPHIEKYMDKPVKVKSPLAPSGISGRRQSVLVSRSWTFMAKAKYVCGTLAPSSLTSQGESFTKSIFT